MVVHKASSFEEAERWDLEYWQSQTPAARLAALVAIHRDIEKVRRHGEDARVLREVKRLRGD